MSVTYWGKAQRRLMEKVPDLLGEQWKPLPGFDNYAISNKRRVKRLEHETSDYGGRHGAFRTRFYCEKLVKVQRAISCEWGDLIYGCRIKLAGVPKDINVGKLVAKLFK